MCAGRIGDHLDDRCDLRVRVLAAEQHARGDGGALLAGQPEPGAPVHRGARLRETLLRRYAHHYQKRRRAFRLQRAQPQQRRGHDLH